MAVRRKPISCCPYCGSKAGIYTKVTLVNVPFRMGFHGEAQYNWEMYDNLERQMGGMLAYCQSCGRLICRMRTLERQWKEGQP